MKIDGKLIAAEILDDIKTEVKRLQKKNIDPRLAVVLIGEDAASLSFVKQKTKAAQLTGITLSLHHFKKTPLYQKLAEFIHELGQDESIHGIIIQRPLPPSLSASSLTKIIKPNKDVDGFLPKSHFLPPLGLAIFKVLNEIYFRHLHKKVKPKDDCTKPFLAWLKSKNIVLIGQGETGGKPISQTFQKYRINFLLINSRTENTEEYISQADILISSVGKSQIIKSNQLKSGAILLGVGVHKEKDKLVGDYDEKEIATTAGYYTPTPGGIGPVNVACLLQNVVTACKKSRY